MTSDLQHGPVTVWYGKMPESNGRQNWTAMLKRNGGDAFEAFADGYTFARSEYPDRVRYEADQVRWLLGEIAERPCLLDYDADLHSGYASPAEQPAPDVREGVRRVIEPLTESVARGFSVAERRALADKKINAILALIEVERAKVREGELNYDGAMSDLESVLTVLIRRINGDADLSSAAEWVRLNYPNRAGEIRLAALSGGGE